MKYHIMLVYLPTELKHHHKTASHTTLFQWIHLNPYIHSNNKKIHKINTKKQLLKLQAHQSYTDQYSFKKNIVLKKERNNYNINMLN